MGCWNCYLALLSVGVLKMHESSESMAHESGLSPETAAASPSESEVVPSLQPGGQLARTGQAPFWQRNPLSTGFSVLLILSYAITTFSTDGQGPPDRVVIVGGFYPPAVQAGEWWRFITATLLHANPPHLFNNVVGLLIFGNLLEPVLGFRRLLVLYALSVFLGLGLSFYMLPNGVTLGASTIDYGLIGAYLSLVLILRYRYQRDTFFREFRGAIFFVLMFVAWNLMESATVNLWGHVGGLLAGVCFALLCSGKPFRLSR